jgi:hypothetical protein
MAESILTDRPGTKMEVPVRLRQIAGGVMRGVYAVVFALVALLGPARLSAKGENVKITIKGASLTAPIEITDKDLLARFVIWEGPGTSPNASHGLIVDWSRSLAAPPPKGLEVYEVEFLTTREGKNTYRVSYLYDTVKNEGYVYIPGKTDSRYAENVWLILRGVEGTWFHAWSDWDAVVNPLLAKMR